MAATKEEMSLWVYDKIRDSLATPMADLNQAGRELWCEQYLAAALSITREYCPLAAPVLVRRVGLDVMMAPPRRRRFAGLRGSFRIRWDKVAGLLVATAPWAGVAAALYFIASAAP
jgi:hypothetical protein